MTSPPPVIHHGSKKLVYSTIAAPLLAGMCILSPLESLKILGATTLTGIAYGICNNMISCRHCIEYFTINPSPPGTDVFYRDIRTSNPNLNALFWGTCPSWIAFAMAGVCLAVQARLPLPTIAGCQFSKISAIEISPFLISAAIIALRTAHIHARKAQRFVEEKKNSWKLLKESHKPNRDFPPDLYYIEDENLWAKWHSCTVRNKKGHDSIALLLLALSGGIWVARAISPWIKCLH